ncbi:DsbA family protein [Enterococcus sp. LJL98]
MIEIYLFIHPLGKFCTEAEKFLLDFSQRCAAKIDLQIVPVVSPKTIAFALKQTPMTLDARNDYYQLTYQIALDFKAAQIQGKKYARDFLLSLQERILYQNQPYSEEMAQALFLKTGGDLDMFLEDRRSELVEELFWRDQKTARDFRVTRPTSAVIYDCSSEQDGLLLEGLETIEAVFEQHLLPYPLRTIEPPYKKTTTAYN